MASANKAVDVWWLAYTESEERRAAYVNRQIDSKKQWDKIGSLPEFWKNTKAFKKFRTLVRNGVPDVYKQQIWLHSARETVTAAKYARLVATCLPVQTRLHIYPLECPMFGGHFPRFSNVLLSETEWGEVRRVLSVIQEERKYLLMCPILPSAAVILRHFLHEHQVYGVLVAILQRQSHHFKERVAFYENSCDVSNHFAMLDELCMHWAPIAFQGLSRHGIAPHQVAIKWYMSLFTEHLPLPCLFDIMGEYLVDGIKAIDRITVALLLAIGDKINALANPDVEAISALAGEVEFSQVLHVAYGLTFRTTTVRRRLSSASEGSPHHPLHPHHAQYELIEQKKNDYVPLYKSPLVHGDSALASYFPRLPLTVRRALPSVKPVGHNDFYCVFSTRTHGYNLETMYLNIDNPPVDVAHIQLSREENQIHQGVPAVLLLYTCECQLLAVYSPTGFSKYGGEAQDGTHSHPQTCLIDFGVLPKDSEVESVTDASECSECDEVCQESALHECEPVAEYATATEPPPVVITPADLTPIDNELAACKICQRLFPHFTLHHCSASGRSGAILQANKHSILLGQGPALAINSEFKLSGYACSVFSTASDWLKCGDIKPEEARIESHIVSVSQCELWLME